MKIDEKYNRYLKAEDGTLREPTIYNYVWGLLKENEELRDSDKKLMWKLWEIQGLIKGNFGSFFDNPTIDFNNFIANAALPTSIFRARQLVQADHPELKSSKEVQEFKDAKEEEKGTFAYRETL